MIPTSHSLTSMAELLKLTEQSLGEPGTRGKRKSIGVLKPVSARTDPAIGFRVVGEASVLVAQMGKLNSQRRTGVHPRSHRV